MRRAEGWADASDPYAAPKILDTALVYAANEMRLTAGQLFRYLDSRVARHDADHAQLLPVVEAASYLVQQLRTFVRE